MRKGSAARNQRLSRCNRLELLQNRAPIRILRRSGEQFLQHRGHRREQLVDLRGVLAAGLGEVRPAAAAAADDRRQLLDELAGLDAGQVLASPTRRARPCRRSRTRARPRRCRGGRGASRTGRAARPSRGRSTRRAMSFTPSTSRVSSSAAPPPAPPPPSAASSSAARPRAPAAWRPPAAAARLDRLVGRRVQRAAATRSSAARCCWTRATAPAPVSASMRRTPAATPLSSVIDEEADVAGRAHVRAAAQLHAEAGHRDDADPVAVLLAEERHRAGRDRLLGRAHLGLRPACCGRSAR